MTVSTFVHKFVPKCLCSRIPSPFELSTNQGLVEKGGYSKKV